VIQFDALAAARVTQWPFRHVVGDGALAPADKGALFADFPAPRKPGFFEVETLQFGETFGQLLQDLRSDTLAEVLEERLDCPLRGKPRIIVARKWSAPKDGRPHTDGRDKLATLLVYLNEEWSASAGQLRMLESPAVDGPGSPPIPPVFGSFVAFARSDNSWHGHPPFKGERRVVQTTWLVDDDALARKTKRHHRGQLVKSLLPAFGFG
jgi:SM-20-related protein